MIDQSFETHSGTAVDRQDVMAKTLEETVDAEVMVVDFEQLKQAYFHGNVEIFGPVDHQAECDDGRSFFLDEDDIRNSSAVIYQEQNWE